MKYKNILFRKDGKIATISLNRPEQLNPINIELLHEMRNAIDCVEEDDDILVLIIKGEGKSFSAGADMLQVYTDRAYKDAGSKEEKGARRPSQRSRLHFDRDLLETYRRILYCWKVTMAQVHGYCIGMGLYMAQACDMAIAAEDAKIGHREQRLTFSGATFMLIKEMIQIGPQKTRELLLTGQLLDGKEAERVGMVNKAVPADQLEAEVQRYAGAIALLPRDGIAIGKAQTFLAYDTLGIGANTNQAFIGHTMATNLRFEPDEYNFVKERQTRGAKGAFHGLHDRFTKLGF